MNDNFESDTKITGFGKDDRGDGQQRPSHVASNTKRNFVEEIEF